MTAPQQIQVLSRWNSEFSEGYGFDLESGQQKWTLASPLGPSPKQALVGAVLACSGMDVVALLRGRKLALRGLTVQGRAWVKSEHPKWVYEMEVHYEAEGDFEPGALMQAIRSSMTLYCGVSATLAQTRFWVSARLNGRDVMNREEVSHS